MIFQALSPSLLQGLGADDIAPHAAVLPPVPAAVVAEVLAAKEEQLAAPLIAEEELEDSDNEVI